MSDIVVAVDRQALAEAIPNFVHMVESGIDVDRIGESLDGQIYRMQSSQERRLGRRSAGGPSYWARVKIEVWKLVCSQDPHYDDVRSKFRDAQGRVGVPLIASFSAVAGAAIGISAALILPICTLALYSVASVGVRAYCSLPPPSTDI